MANDIEIVATAKQTVDKDFNKIGTAVSSLDDKIQDSAASTESAFDASARGASKLGKVLDYAQGALDQTSGAFDAVGGAAESVQDIMSHGERKAEELAEAHLDLEQASIDASQAIEDMEQAERNIAKAAIDSRQAANDNKRAILERADAQKVYNDAVKKHGKGSREAKEAMLDLTDAEIRFTETLEEMAQAERDAEQAKIESRQASLDLKDANHRTAKTSREMEEAGSSLTKIAEWGGMLSGVLGGLSGVLGIVTIAQWGLNTAFLASPITWIIVGITALVGVVIWAATKTQFFQRVWGVVWKFVSRVIGTHLLAAKQTVSNVIGAISRLIGMIPRNAKRALAGIAMIILGPFSTAFRNIAHAWNRTIGRLAWTVPSWVPGIGGSSVSVPNLPTFAVGGDITRTGLALVHAGETVVPTAKADRFRDAMAHGADGVMGTGDIRIVLEFKPTGNPMADAVISLLEDNVKVRAVVDNSIRDTVNSRGNGSVQVAYGKRGS
jgi:hypothetical protein